MDARASASVAGYDVHSSKLIAISDLKTRWIRIDSSGDKNTGAPSIGDRKLAPSSVIFRISFKLQT